MDKTYDQKEVGARFLDRTMKTNVCVKMDASEHLCRQLELVTYHPEVDASQPQPRPQATVNVPGVKVQQVQIVKLPPVESRGNAWPLTHRGRSHVSG